MPYNLGVIVLIISNRPRATRVADLKLLARLLLELYPHSVQLPLLRSYLNKFIKTHLITLQHNFDPQ